MKRSLIQPVKHSARLGVNGFDGPALGPELVLENGWSLPAGFSQDGQMFTLDAVDVNILASRTSIFEVGAKYRWAIVISGLSQGAIRLTTGASEVELFTQNGTFSGDLTATETQARLQVRVAPVTATAWLSLKKLL